MGRRPSASGPLLGWVSALVHAQRARLIRAVRREGLDPEDALDCVQDAFHGFLAMPHARLLADAPDDAARVLSVVARNIARNRRRKHHRARPHLSDEVTLGELRADATAPDELVMHAESYASMVGCVATLSTIQQRVVDLRLVDDVPGDDVAKTLGLTPGNVAVLLHRAKQKLRACVPDAD